MVAAFMPMAADERQKLITALRGNAEDGLALLMNPRDTSFAGAGPLDAEEDEAKARTINAIRSVPSHY